MNAIRRLAIPALIASILLLPAFGAWAQSDEALIKYRQKVMGSLGANMGAIGDILKEKLPYGDHIAGHAANLKNSAEQIAAAFKKQITDGATDAKPGIWKDFSDYRAKADDLAKEAAKLQQVAGSGDMKAVLTQVKAVGETCKACHKEYRKPKEESYKRK